MEPNKIRFVTANYYQLQGLRLVPIGLALILLGLASAGRLDWVPPAVGVVPASARARLLTWVGYAVGMMFALAVAAPAYYRWRYGTVDQFNRRWRNRWLTVAVIGFFVLVKVDNRLDWPVALSWLLVSVSLFIAVWHDGRIRIHYLAAAILWLVASFVPVLNMSPSDSKLLEFVLGGLTLISCGIGDHVLLARTLATPQTTEDVSHPATV